MSNCPKKQWVNSMPYRRAEWYAEIRELLGELHHRDVVLDEKLIERLRFDGIDPTPPMRSKTAIPNLAPVLVW